MKGLVSIVIPTFNRARYLRDALDSVFGQTVRNFEVVLIDDGSTDDTKDVIKQYGSEIRYFYQENSGRSVARNRGLAEARGEYIAFLDSDDIWYPDHLQRQFDYLDRHSDTVFLHGLIDEIREDGTKEIRGSQQLARLFAKANKKKYTYEKLLDSCLIFTSTLLVSRKLLEEVGGYAPGLLAREDLELYLRIVRVARIGYLGGTPITSYRRHAGNVYIELGNKAILGEYKKIFLRHTIEQKKGVVNAKALAQAHLSISSCCAGLGEKVQCRTHILQAMKLNIGKALSPRVIARFIKTLF